jgi:CRISPR-associated endonuclease Cas1
VKAGVSLKPQNGVVTVAGYGVRISVERGHLAVEDGIGADRRKTRFSRVTSRIKRFVVLGHSGTISLEALRWLHDIKAAFVQIDSDGELIVAAAPSALNESRLRRAQALASVNGIAIEIGRELTREKLDGQLRVAERLSAIDRVLREIRENIAEIDLCDSADELRIVEATAANFYWSAWRELPMRFESGSAKRVPDHWLRFGARHSLISRPSPRRAVNPANAILNYLYAILEAEARIAALRMGLDPGLGLLHIDQGSRNSLPCDLMEPMRPKVDAYVLDLLRSRTFKKSDFFETREGICRIMPPLTQELAHTGPMLAKELGPVTERVARMLFEAARNTKAANAKGKAESTGKRQLPTPLTEANRSAGRQPYKRKPHPDLVEEMKAKLFGAGAATNR